MKFVSRDEVAIRFDKIANGNVNQMDIVRSIKNISGGTLITPTLSEIESGAPERAAFQSATVLGRRSMRVTSNTLIGTLDLCDFCSMAR